MNEALTIEIRAEIDNLQKQLNKARKEVEGFGKKGTKGIKDFNTSVQKAAQTSRKAFAIVGASITAAAGALLALGASTKEYRTQQAQLTTAFEAAGSSAEVATSTYNDLYRVLGDSGQATEAAQHLAKLTTEEQALSEWTNICQGVYATFGSSLPLESLTEAVNHSAKLGEVQGTLADALEWSGVNVEDFNAQLLMCNSESEREALIRDTLNGKYSEAAAIYEENAAAVMAQNEAQARLDEATAKLGEVLAPINTMLNEFAAAFLTQISPAVQEFATQHGAKLQKVLTDVATAIGKVLTWIIDNWDLVSTVATVVLAIVAALQVYSAVMAVVNAVMAANPISLIVIAIGALIAIIVLCVKHWDSIKEAASKAWNWIKNIWGSVADWFSNSVVKPLGKFFSSMWDGLKNGASKAWEGIKSVFSAVGNFFRNTFTKAWEGVKAVFSAGGKVFVGIKDGIVTAFKTVVNALIKGINAVVTLPFKGLNGILNTLQNISIAGVSPFSWLSWRAPMIELPYLARGGVVDDATIAMIGEQGKEAVVPLENNLEWLNLLADMLTDRMGGGSTPIVLQVDGKTFAQTAVRTINDLTRERGRLALNMM